VVKQDSKQEPEHSTKIEEATEKAAATIRKAAARAAEERAHARTRTSVMAGLGLVLGVVAVLAVATGLLAVIGVGVGVAALLISIGGVTATGNHYPYLAGRLEALIGVILAAAAILVGILAVVGALPALDTDANLVEQLHEQLPSWLR
jgi:hypothetical protein